MRVTLIGYRATGKSSTAPLLAQSLRWTWYDSDDEVERRAGKTIADLFAEQGEPHFRELEAEVIRELCERSRSVLSVGGGAVLKEETRRLLRCDGLVFWLQARPATILTRMQRDAQNDSRRPRLTKLPAAEEIRQQLAVREPIYASLADACFDTESLTTDKMVSRMMAEVRRQWPQD